LKNLQFIQIDYKLNIKLIKIEKKKNIIKNLKIKIMIDEESSTMKIHKTIATYYHLFNVKQIKQSLNYIQTCEFIISYNQS